MNPAKMTDHELLAALHATLAACKETRGSENLKQARQRLLFRLKAEAATRNWAAVRLARSRQRRDSTGCPKFVHRDSFVIATATLASYVIGAMGRRRLATFRPR